MAEDDDSAQSTNGRELFTGWLSSLTCSHKADQSDYDSDIDYAFIDQSEPEYGPPVPAVEGYNGSSAEYKTEEVRNTVDVEVAPEIVIYTKTQVAVKVTYPSSTGLRSAAV